MNYYINTSLIVILLISLFIHISILYKKIQRLSEKLSLIDNIDKKINDTLNKKLSSINNDFDNIDEKIENLDKKISFIDNSMYVNIMENYENEHIEVNNYFIPLKIEKLNIIYNKWNNCGIYMIENEYCLMNPLINVIFNLDKLNCLNEVKITLIGDISYRIEYKVNCSLFENIKHLTCKSINLSSFMFDLFNNINTEIIELDGNINMDYFNFIKCFVNLKNIKITNVKKMRMEQIKNNIEEHCKTHNCVLEFI
jgi:archaellum component FlaF (FlaF/FlaG flagellin family)